MESATIVSAVEKVREAVNELADVVKETYAGSQGEQVDETTADQEAGAVGERPSGALTPDQPDTAGDTAQSAA